MRIKGIYTMLFDVLSTYGLDAATQTGDHLVIYPKRDEPGTGFIKFDWLGSGIDNKLLTVWKRMYACEPMYVIGKAGEAPATGFWKELHYEKNVTQWDAIALAIRADCVAREAGEDPDDFLKDYPTGYFFTKEEVLEIVQRAVNEATSKLKSSF